MVACIPRHADARVAALIDFFETLAPATLERLGEFYAAEAFFKDPFHELRGAAAIEALFRRMFDGLETPRFVVDEAIAEGTGCVLIWRFLFVSPRLGPGEQCIRGASHLRLDGDGRVVLHRDYWDAAEELYAKLPVVGALVRWLGRRIAAGQ